MKKIVLALAVAVAAAAAANAQTPAAKPAPKSAQTKPATKGADTDMKKAPKAAPMKMEVVSTDATAKTITVKDTSGGNMTLTATGGAVAVLANLKAGDMVMVTHTDTNATKITKVKAMASSKKTPKK